MKTLRATALASLAALAPLVARAQTAPSAQPAAPPATSAAPAATAQATAAPTAEAPPATAAPAPAATAPEAAAPPAPQPAAANAPAAAASDGIATNVTSPATPTPATIDEPRPSVPAPPTPLVDAWLGVHGLIVPSAAYDAFSEDDALTSFTVGAGLSLVRSGSTHIAAVASLSTSNQEATFRGADTELSVLRITLGPELRFPFAGRFYAYGRLSPQLLQSSAKLADSSAQADLEEEEWLLGVDGALGVAARVAEVSPDSASGPVCFFLRAEAGYTWSPSSELELAPGAGAPIRTDAVALGDMSLSGISFRGAVGVGY